MLGGDLRTRPRAFGSSDRAGSRGHPGRLRRLRRRRRGWGRILAITSITVRRPVPSLILSNTARAGATGFLKTLAGEVAADGVTVNSIQPGLHDTARLRSVWGAELPAVTQKVPARRLGDPADFGRLAALLCSEWAGYLTGAAIPVDGGLAQGLQ